MRETTKRQQSIETGKPTLRERADALRARVPEVATDPVHHVIAASITLLATAQKTRGGTAAKDVADDAAWQHFRKTVIKTAPITPAGAVALAKHTVAFNASQGNVLDEAELSTILKLIARTPTF